MVKLSEFAGKKYKLDHSASVNFDEYMKAIGVGMITRTIGNTVVATYELLVDGDTYTLKSYSTFKNYSVSFKLGEEIEYETPDGRKVKATATLEGNKLIEVQRGEKIKTTKIIREFCDKEIVCTLTVEGEDFTATRVYRVVE